jgi:predicted nucleotidyltransferase component of viral defense system
MIKPDNPYFRQVELLVRVLPFVARETCFALKGGTAINLFLRDLPRLSVDIDLAFLPLTDYPTARRQISEALNRIREQLTTGSPAYQVVTGSNDGSGAIDTLNVSSGANQVKIEVNPVLRGSFEPPQTIRIRPAAEDAFGFAEVTALSFNDIYAGKLMAAIDRQHPRDLFDAKLLIENEGFTDDLFRTLLVYLIGHKGSLADSLDPRRKDIKALYEQQFRGMTAQPVSLDELLEVREKLINKVRSRIGEREKHFLLSLKKCDPDWKSIDLQHAQDLPAVKWKLFNLRNMSKKDHEKAVARLQRTLDAI